MISRSYANLLDLTASAAPVSSSNRGLPKVMTVAGVLSDIEESQSSALIPPSLCRIPQPERIIIVANTLPICLNKSDPNCVFSWDHDSLLLHIKHGLPPDSEILYVGCLTEDATVSLTQEEATSILLNQFNCLPVFVPLDLWKQYHDGFCKNQLWPLFHYMLPMASDHHRLRFDRSLWQAYVSVNKMFANKVMEVLSPDQDYVWVHDYHLMAFPTFLRKRFFKVKLGFFLHTPFPSSEMYRTLPVREELLRGLLNSDIIGFHTFDYARHFLSCCSRMLGLHFKTQRGGSIGLEYFGRTVGIKIMPVGIDMVKMLQTMEMAETRAKLWQLKQQFEGKTVILGVDDLDIFQGINLKLLAMEKLLLEHPEWREKLVMVQIASPSSSNNNNNNNQEIKKEIQESVRRINKEFGCRDYEPVLLIEKPVSMSHRIAYYTIAECCIVTAVRDGLNLIPYEYTVCRQGKETAELETKAMVKEQQQSSTLVLSEFIGCSPSLSGAIRVNPWNIDHVSEAIHSALTMPSSEKEMRHEKHYKYLSSHDLAYWVKSFMTDLKRTCQDHAQYRCWGIGFGFGFRIVALDASFRKLSLDHITSAYKRSTNRLILLDYDGTIVPCNAINKAPTPQISSLLNSLCADPDNLIFIVSGRSRNNLNQWFSQFRRLGLSAEHGYFNRWHQDAEWITSGCASDFSWKDTVMPVLRRYAESTDGSSIEEKETSLVWHYQDADPDFGSWQAKQLLDNLESMLANKPVAVKSGHQIVEIKPQGVSKGTVAEELLLSMVKKGKPPEFVLCVGDDRSDEDMFESISTAMEGFPQTPLAEVFACTVGQKPSKAKYYLEDTVEVVKMLQGLVAPSELQVDLTWKPCSRNVFHLTSEKLR